MLKTALASCMILALSATFAHAQTFVKPDQNVGRDRIKKAPTRPRTSKEKIAKRRVPSVKRIVIIDRPVRNTEPGTTVPPREPGKFARPHKRPNSRPQDKENELTPSTDPTKNHGRQVSMLAKRKQFNKRMAYLDQLRDKAISTGNMELMRKADLEEKKLHNRKHMLLNQKKRMR